jgi:hypothetical protein
LLHDVLLHWLVVEVVVIIKRVIGCHLLVDGPRKHQNRQKGLNVLVYASWYRDQSLQPARGVGKV